MKRYDPAPVKRPDPKAMKAHIDNLHEKGRVIGERTQGVVRRAAGGA